MMRTLALLLLLGGCGASGLTIANGVGLGVSSSALVCDWAGTRSRASGGWKPYQDADGEWRQPYESNPLMGDRPDSTVVDAYCLGVLILSSVAWRLVPRRYRIAVPILVTAISVKASINNAVNDVGVCGVGGVTVDHR